VRGELLRPETAISRLTKVNSLPVIESTTRRPLDQRRRCWPPAKTEMPTDGKACGLLTANACNSSVRHDATPHRCPLSVCARTRQTTLGNRSVLPSKVDCSSEIGSTQKTFSGWLGASQKHFYQGVRV
jgi:hypothetical protein